MTLKTPRSHSPRANAQLGPSAHWALPGLLLFMGIEAMAWAPRIPELRTSLALSDGQFGLVLVTSSVGAAVGAQLSVRLTQKQGSGALLRIAQSSMTLGVMMMGLAPNVWVLTIGLFFVGLGRAGMDIGATSQVLMIGKLIRNKFLASLHGAWSI